MEWNQLHYFQTVANLEHFTRAAESLMVSQPALSRSMARLEEELGVPLFDRHGRTVSLNRYGHIFLKRVNRALLEIAEGQKEIQDLVNPSSGTVSLGFIHSQGTNLVPDLIGSFRKQYPAITFQLFQNTSRLILDQLEAAEADFCLCTQPAGREGIKWTELYTEKLFVIVPKEHRLANRASIKLNEVAEDPFILVKKGNGLREITDRLIREAGFTPNVTFEGEELTTVASLVAANLGVAIIPHLRGLDLKNLAELPVSEPICQRIIGMAWVEGRYLSPAARRFQEFVLAYFAQAQHSDANHYLAPASPPGPQKPQDMSSY